MTFDLRPRRRRPLVDRSATRDGANRDGWWSSSASSDAVAPGSPNTPAASGRSVTELAYAVVIDYGLTISPAACSAGVEVGSSGSPVGGAQRGRQVPIKRMNHAVSNVGDARVRQTFEPATVRQTFRRTSEPKGAAIAEIAPRVADHRWTS